MKYKSLLAACAAVLIAAGAGAQTPAPADSTAPDSLARSTVPPAPPTNLRVADKGNDHGHAIVLKWDLSTDDTSGAHSVVSYEGFHWEPYLVDTMHHVLDSIDEVSGHIREHSTAALRRKRDSLRQVYEGQLKRLKAAYEQYPNGGEWRGWKPNLAPSGVNHMEQIGDKETFSQTYLPDFTDFYYRVDAVTADSTVRSSSNIAGPVQSKGQWYNKGRTSVMISVIVFGILVVWFVQRAKSGASLYVRPLAGIEAVDDAIGRATEMGRPILYVLGLGSAADIATIASFTILSRVAKRVAEYQTGLNVPAYDPIVMSVAQEVVKSAYLDAGRPDDYKEETVHFVTQSQFAYVAAVNGIMLRERPATNVYMGVFFAESLILAETGALAGSIQISGTDQIAQIPFFIVACDYTLIGEELYAASAYLGREPVLLGSLKAQDYLKAAVIVLALLGVVAASLGWGWFVDLFRVTN